MDGSEVLAFQRPGGEPSNILKPCSTAEWISELSMAEGSKNSIKRCKKEAGFLLAFFKTEPAVLEANEKKFREYILDAKVKRELKASSMVTMFATINSYFNWAVKNGYIRRNPLILVKRPKQGKREAVFLSHEQAVQLINAADKPKFRAYFHLTYGSGLRLDEARKMKLNDFLYEGRACRVRGKGDKERLVPISQEAADAIKAYLPYREIDLKKIRRNSEYLFPGFKKDSNDCMGPGTIQSAITRARISANLPVHATVHTLRHSIATNLLNKGMDVRKVQELLGHSNLATTQKYTHVTEKQVLDSYNEFSPFGTNSKKDDDAAGAAVKK